MKIYVKPITRGTSPCCTSMSEQPENTHRVKPFREFHKRTLFARKRKQLTPEGGVYLRSREIKNKIKTSANGLSRPLVFQRQSQRQRRDGAVW